MLSEIPSGKTVKIRRHHAAGATRQRLLDLGFSPETEVTVVRRAPLGDPMQCKVATCDITLRRAEAALIEVDLPVS